MGESKIVFGVVFFILLTGGLIGGAEEIRQEAGKEEYVVTLDHSNFTETVSKHDFIVVEFYAPWCGHCQHLAPEYEKAAAALSRHDPPITLSKVDAGDESNSEIAVEFKIQGFPTLKIFRNGGKSVQEYNGPREADGIAAYLKKQFGPASARIDSVEEASKHIDLNAIFIAGVFPELSGSEYENFTKLAEKLRSDYDFGHTLDAKLLPGRGRPSSSVDEPTIRILKPFDELSVDTKDFQIEAAEKFIEENTIPSLTFFDTDPNNQGYLNKYFDNDNHKVMLFLNFSSDKFDAFKSRMQDLATLFKGQGMSFLIGDVEASMAAFQFYGIEEERAPVFVIHTNDDKKYIKDNLETEQVAPWFKSYLDGKLEPFKKSQPIPETNDEPVKVVVADTLQDLVLDSDKNVLLEFYAPWCGHCKSLAPILDEIALSYQNDPNVVIAKFDATTNDVTVDAPFNVQGFPTIYFKTAGGKIIDYGGHRTKEAIVQFIQDNRSDAAAAAEASTNLIGPKLTQTCTSACSVKNEDAGVKRSDADAEAADDDGGKPLKDEL